MSQRLQRLPSALAAIILALGLTACNRPSSDAHKKSIAPPSASQSTTTAPVPEAAAVSAVANHSCDAAKSLQARVDSFAGQPDAASLQSAQTAWKIAHLAYREYQQMRALAGLPKDKGSADTVDATPMLPGYLDSVPGYPASGLVHAGTPLTPAYLRQEHRSTDPYFLTLGFHPLAFMLFGTPQEKGGARKASDFVSPKPLPADHIDNAARRRQLVRIMAAELTPEVQSLCGNAPLQKVTAAMQKTLRDPALFRQHLAAWLNTEIVFPLNAWKTNPGGEDNNGVPVSHTALPGIDFEEWQAMLESVSSTWVPLTRPDARLTLQADIKQLEDAIKPLTRPPYPPAPAAVATALDQVSQVIRQWVSPTTP
ncbi:imelysin family protein [Mangrovitalea sediminis]|uniref:imelysin family protein n=1 Tax=Mangrovitalea sediminis TaxID=1982043 RepID=UPI000BE5A975|nr:imelysin family protein [Mangrovitalea sediminis]